MGQMHLQGQDVRVRLIANNQQVADYDGVTEASLTFKFERKEVNILGARSTTYEMVSKGVDISISALNRSKAFFDILAVVKGKAERTNVQNRIEIHIQCRFPSGAQANIILIDVAFGDMGFEIGGREDHASNAIEGSTGEYQVA